MVIAGGASGGSTDVGGGGGGAGGYREGRNVPVDSTLYSQSPLE